MTYNQVLAQRIRDILGTRPGLIEKKMFGGVGFILNGNMACGVQGDELIVRVGAANNDSTLSRPFVRPFPAPDGKPMAGWIFVSMQGLIEEGDLREWVEQGYEFARSLPEKKKG